MMCRRRVRDDKIWWSVEGEKKKYYILYVWGTVMAAPPNEAYRHQCYNVFKLTATRPYRAPSISFFLQAPTRPPPSPLNCLYSKGP